ncbi:hypothetical protein [Streptomyces sp. NBC_01262]|uniref:hypothetical protein n=1 Tax=Streptomyces sp. NBC_01262 TaxID=2903803 RepID=UPI002E2ECEB6|nr:hypothetical protein [Streptomyces sp. NBC_01262]
MAEPKVFDVPDRIILLQQEWYATEAELEAIPTPPIDPEIGGRPWTTEQLDQMAGLRERLRDLAGRIAVDDWWATVAREDLVDARMAVNRRACRSRPLRPDRRSGQPVSTTGCCGAPRSRRPTALACFCDESAGQDARHPAASGTSGHRAARRQVVREGSSPGDGVPGSVDAS